MIGVAAGVQDLQGDLAACLVDGGSDLPVLLSLRLVFEHRRAGHHHPVLIGRDAAGHDQPDAPTRALGIEGGETGKALRGFFEAGMHRAHQDAILQRRKAEVERSKQVGIREWNIR